MKKSIERLQRENKLDLLIKAIDDSNEEIFATKQDGTLIFANERFRHYHGIGDDDDVMTLNIKDLHPVPQTGKMWEQIVMMIHDTNEQTHYRLSQPAENANDMLAYEGNAFSVIDDKTRELSYWIFGSDISENIRQEQEIKRYHLVLDKIMENLPASIVVKDVNSGFKYVYRNRESFNRDIVFQDPVGKDDFDFHPKEVAERKRKQDIELAETGNELHWIAEEKDRNGESIYLDKRKIRIANDEASPFLLSIEWDITDMEIMKRKLKVAKEKAETSDKLKSAFLANMSHEIRTPLNAIVGFSQLIAECPDADERRTYYGIVEENSEHLLQLINEILDLSKIEAGMSKFTIEPMSMDAVCNKIYNMVRLRCPEGVELIYEKPQDDLVVMADKSRVTQVVTNLIGNAYKFTTQGSIRYGFSRKGEMVEVYVSDTGAGIEESKLSSVFDRFVKANENVAGTGLGLSISRTIVERLGGEINVTSKVGEGTTFTFTLPYSEDSVKEEVSDLIV